MVMLFVAVQVLGLGMQAEREIRSRTRERGHKSFLNHCHSINDDYLEVL